MDMLDNSTIVTLRPLTRYYVLLLKLININNRRSIIFNKGNFVVIVYMVINNVILYIES